MCYPVQRWQSERLRPRHKPTRLNKGAAGISSMIGTPPLTPEGGSYPHLNNPCRDSISRGKPEEAVEIKYADKKLEQTISNPRKLKKDHGADVQKLVLERLEDMESAETLAEYMYYPRKCKELAGDRKGQFSVRLDSKKRLVFTHNEQVTHLKPDGGLDLRRVTKVKILEIVNYHRK